MSDWRSNLSNLKTMIKLRYQNAKATVKTGLRLTDEEYNKYFKDL